MRNEACSQCTGSPNPSITALDQCVLVIDRYVSLAVYWPIKRDVVLSVLPTSMMLSD